MTKQNLEQIYYLSKELKMWERELERLKARSLVQSPVPHAGTSGRISDKVADRAERVMELESRISAKREEIQQLRDEAVEYIKDIPDSLTRMIIYYRCVSLMSWRRVAYEVGGSNTEEGVKKVYYRFFEKSCPECPD